MKCLDLRWSALFTAALLLSACGDDTSAPDALGDARVDAPVGQDGGVDSSLQDSGEDAVTSDVGRDTLLDTRPLDVGLDTPSDTATDACSAADEVCDGLDNDCDGNVDENLVQQCGTSEGVCMPGMVQCIDGTFGACTPEQGPAPETCNGEDDNCNGRVDEGVAARNCGTNVGRCQRGTRSCTGGSFGACMGQVAPRAERCDGIDDDCNGRVDDGIAVTSCGSNVGECVAGRRRCVDGAFTCQGRTRPQPEANDGLDNDCDGSVDEGIACENNIQRAVRTNTNSERRSRGRGNLVCDLGLGRAAKIQVDDMCRTGTFAHVIDGVDLRDRLREARATYSTAGENLAYGEVSAAAMVAAWMDSADHRANILNPAFGRIGVAVRDCRGTRYWVQVFAD